MPTPEEIAAAQATADKAEKVGRYRVERFRPDMIVLAVALLGGGGIMGKSTYSTGSAVESLAAEMRTFRSEVGAKVETTNTAVSELRGQLLVFEKAKIEERMRDLERQAAESHTSNEELRERVKTLEEQLRRGRDK